MATPAPTTDPHALTLSAFLAAVRMANLSYNLAQRDSPPTAEEWQRIRQSMKENQAMWDAGKGELRKVVSASASGEGK